MTSTSSTRSSWIPRRIPAVGRGGMVAAKMPQAADAGLAMLRKGGNAIDAAVATAFAVGVVEPPMNGTGGGGYMTVWLAKEKRSVVIDFPMISAAAATPGMFQLAPAGKGDGFLFGWPSTINDENVIGYRSIAVPGTVAGLALALERYGTLTLAEVMEPAIALAENGFPVTWQTTLHIAKDVATLARFPATAATFLTPEGHPLKTSEQLNPTMIRQPDLAKTLRTIADQGHRAFYEGELARTITDHLQENGSEITADDFAAYRAQEIDGITIDYHGHQIHTVGGGTGGTSMGEALTMLNEIDAGNPGNRSARELHMMTQIFRQAFADRFAYLADPDQIAIPQSALLDPAYARERIATFDPERSTTPAAGDRGRLGVSHTMPASVPEYVKSGSTTHLGTMDAEGNAVALTQTLLALWGSRVTIPGTGVLMNNGMMWFDPEPGRPNSIGRSKKPLSNMAPAIITKDGEAIASIGSSGGRRIQNCNAQIIMNIVDGGMTMQEAVDAPRIDTSTKALAISTRFGQPVINELAAMGHPVSPRDESLMTSDFASPVAIRRSGNVFDGGADPWYYSATTAALDEV
ncbi:MAG TPA: gamma-glutamyltransferase [Thermomicrobiales bacterium]|nr:gamma-glutamyltransferase [Thermomicrobiales bacterium]